MGRWWWVNVVGLVLAGCGPQSGTADGGMDGGSDGESDDGDPGSGSSEGGEPATTRQVWSVVGRCGGGNDVALLADGRIAVVGDGYLDDDTTEESVGYVQLYSSEGEAIEDLSLVDPAIAPNAVAIGDDDEIVVVGSVGSGGYALALDPAGDPIAAIEPVVYEGGELELVDVTRAADGALLVLGNARSVDRPEEYAVWVGSWTLGDTLDESATLATGAMHFEPEARSIAVTPQGIAVCGSKNAAEGTLVWTAAFDADFAELWSDRIAGSSTSGYQDCNAVTAWGDGLLSAGQVEPEGGMLYAYDATGEPIDARPSLPPPQAGALVEVVDLAVNDTLLALGGRDKDFPSTGRRSWIRWHDGTHALVGEVEATEDEPLVQGAAPDIRAIAMADDGSVVAVGTLETGGSDGCVTRLWLAGFVLE